MLGSGNGQGCLFWDILKGEWPAFKNHTRSLQGVGTAGGGL